MKTRSTPQRILLLMTASAMLVGLFAAPASAHGNDDAPAQICKEANNTWEIPDDTGHPFKFIIQSDGGCASSVAQGFDGTFDNWNLTRSAYNSQCKFLEAEGVVVYPYEFYGNPDWTAYNRADCRKILQFFHESSGE